MSLRLFIVTAHSSFSTILEASLPHLTAQTGYQLEAVGSSSETDHAKSQILNLKDDISELHKEILKLRRQKRLMTESYELEIADLNKKIKNNEPEQRFNSSGINIIINSEGQSSKSKENLKQHVCILFLFIS